MRLRHLSSLTAAFAAALMTLAAVAGADPLVSGYGGPGSGDQTVLGSQLLPGGKGGGGNGTGGGESAPSIRATAALAPAPAPAPATPASSTGSTAPPAPAAKTAKATQGDRRTARKKAGRPAPTTSPSRPTPPRATPTPRPGANTSAGALPVDGGDLLIMLLALAGVGLLATASARLGRDAPVSA